MTLLSSLPSNAIPAQNARGIMAGKSGFSLLELLAVITILAIITLATSAIVPRVPGNTTHAAYQVAGVLEMARTHAVARNTYVWVGFFEEDAATATQTPAVAGNGGRVIIMVVASRDGSRYSDAEISASLPGTFGKANASNPVELEQIGSLVRLENIRLAAVNVSAGNQPSRPYVAAAYQMGDPLGAPPDNTAGNFAILAQSGSPNPATIRYPLGASNPQYTFSKIIEFNPRGEASKIAENVFSGPGPQDAMEIALVPTRGGDVVPDYLGENKAAAAVQIEGLTGRARVFRL